MKTPYRRPLALLLAAVLAAAPLCTSALAAGELEPVCDESYYATLDYYGGLMDASVVKSYQTNGHTSLTDYGTYDDIINLTDDRTPTVSDGTVTFDLGEDAPSRFYFEGKTQQPFHDLPWTFSVSYKLNGAPALAEDLAGKTGLVEIDLDVLPNPNASEYSRNNLVLTAATAFNADDILSLEAPGAEVQLVGNLRTVLFMVMPGEEQHFAIRVGSDDFSFSGLVLLAVPATLQQLDQIADLREAKEKVEDSYDAINDSMDVILNTLDGMSGSLNATASGLDRLNAARGTISSGKGQVYDSADAALADLDALNGALAPLNGHLDTASQALTDTTGTLTALTENAVALKPELSAARKSIQNLQSDTKKLKELAGSIESYNKEAAQIAGNLENDFSDMSDALEDLERSLAKLESALKGAKGVSEVDTIHIGGFTSSEQILEKLEEVQAGKATYDQMLAAGLLPEGTTFEQFLMIPTEMGGPGKTAEEAQLAVKLLEMSQEADFEEQLKLLDTANSAIPGVNDKIDEVNSLVSGLAKPTANVVDDLQSLTIALGEDGLSDDLTRLSKLASDLLKDLKAHEGDAAGLLDHLDELGDLAGRVTQNADTALDLVQKLDDTLNTYEPQAQQALTDAKALSDTTQAALKDTHAFLSSAEALLKQSGPSLDDGPRQTLSGLSDALRRSTAGLEQTGTIRNAKDTITSLIDDEWDSHTGGDNNLLLMDAGAGPGSLTSAQNGNPQSVQYIMRTQEIKADEEESQQTLSQQSADQGTFWSRVAAMFRDFWNAITGLFRK
ncbi:hypothetical protein [Intestinimonas massiliensis (ex Afouda et al. 2020)]|uniref:hypothetical protein n=1 Tax=Intestinimonas massiliensis (ex Afouda et al. 2020) TaxID=1673721 RepID=UPI00067EA826|nr:hypothetical protein [Intestinimonas massiliensis (ex Afouda et al. 2020)]